MDVGSSEKALDDSLKENNNNNDHLAKETDPNLPNQDQFAQELNPNLPNEDRFAKETNPNLPNASDFTSAALLFQNDDNFHPNPLNETKEETEPQSFLGESTVSDAFRELYSSNGALEAAYEEMRNELMGDFDMDFVGPTHGSNAIDENNNINNDNNNNNMGGNIYVDQEVNLLDAPKETLNEMPSQEKTLNNTTASFETEKMEFQFPLKKDEEDRNNEEKKSPLNGDSRDGNEEVDITDKPQNNNIICENICTDQEASLLNAPKITNETENDTTPQEKTRTNEEDQKNEDRTKNSPFNENNNDDHEEEEEEEEIDIMDSNENGSQNEETLKGSPINNNNSNNNNNNDDEEEELVDIMDSNENDSQNVKSPSIEEEGDDRYEDALELQIPQSVQALNAGPSSPNRETTSRSRSVDKSDDHRKRGRKRSRSKSKSRSRERERRRGKSRRRSTTRDRDRRVSRSPAGRRRRRVRSRSPISLRDLRRGGSPRRLSPIRRRRSPPPRSSLRRRPSPPPVRRRRPPSPPPVRRSTGFGRPGKNLYVTGFSFDTTVDDLETKFSKFGSVSGTRIVRDRSGESKGFGFLSMDTDLEADEAIRALDGKVWNNKVLVVEKTKSSQRS